MADKTNVEINLMVAIIIYCNGAMAQMCAALYISCVSRSRVEVARSNSNSNSNKFYLSIACLIPGTGHFVVVVGNVTVVVPCRTAYRLLLSSHYLFQRLQ